MNEVQRCHESLLRQRTQIRHHKTTRRWMKRCWVAAAHADASVMTRDEYEDMYSILLYEMTICWEEELNEAILAKMWKRDAGSHLDIDLERFCCSIFFFVEMWIEEITMSAFEKVFRYVELVLLGKEHLAIHDGDCTESQLQPLFKPTLESLSNRLNATKYLNEFDVKDSEPDEFAAFRECQWARVCDSLRIARLEPPGKLAFNTQPLTVLPISSIAIAPSNHVAAMPASSQF